FGASALKKMTLLDFDLRNPFGNFPVSAQYSSAATRCCKSRRCSSGNRGTCHPQNAAANSRQVRSLDRALFSATAAIGRGSSLACHSDSVMASRPRGVELALADVDRKSTRL